MTDVTLDDVPIEVAIEIALVLMRAGVPLPVDFEAELMDHGVDIPTLASVADL